MSVTPNYKSAAVRVIHGTWTHAEGADEETLTVAGYVYSAKFSDCDSSESHDVGIPYSLSRSTTTGITTITVHAQAAVTDGRFILWSSSM